MRRLATALVAALALASAAPAGAAEYLALGDSVPVWNGAHSYPNLIQRHYQRSTLPRLGLTNLAISFENTTSMIRGGQYGRAKAFLRAHRGHVALITIDIGGNDIVGCVAAGGADPKSPCAVEARAAIKRNLTSMLRGLHRLAPGVPIYGMTYYDPFLGDWLGGGSYRDTALSTLPGLRTLNDELRTLYGGAKWTADVEGVFRSYDFDTIVSSPWGDVPIAVQRACAWLDITCTPGQPEGFGDDPNEDGAVVIAREFERTIGKRPRRTS
jgi:lysophospholipase L1-like esterase